MVAAKKSLTRAKPIKPKNLKTKTQGKRAPTKKATVKATRTPKAKKTVRRRADAPRRRKFISGAKVIRAFEDLQAVTGAQDTFATERGLGM
jgi:hypothetical protein